MINHVNKLVLKVSILALLGTLTPVHATPTKDSKQKQLTSASKSTAGAAISDAQVKQILEQRIDLWQRGVGVVVGIIDARGSRFISHGKFDQASDVLVDPNSVFEIGSVTKVFTSLLLADMAQRGEVALTDPISNYLPSGIKLPMRDGKPIRLIDLANHTSGLPRLPSNLAPADPTNPYADYSLEQLLNFLSTYELPRNSGEKYEYSNLGVGILGQVLAMRAGSDFETLIKTRITETLGMKSTTVTLDKDLQSRMTVGHNESLKAVPNWDLPTLAGAGALRSDAKDMLKFVGAHLGLLKSSLKPAMNTMLAQFTPTENPNVTIGLGWHKLTARGASIIEHNGGTGGFRSFVGFNPASKVGVVVLSNTGNEGMDDIGRHILDVRFELIEQPKARTKNIKISIDPNTLESFVGQYELMPSFVLTVSREGDKLFVQATGQGRGEVHAKGARDFFSNDVDASVSFDPDVNGKAPSLVLHQAGRDMKAMRVEEKAATIAEPESKSETLVSADILDQYVGNYALAPNFILSLTRDGEKFYAQATNQPKFELFAKDAKNFYLKVVDAQIKIDTDASGHGISLTLFQGGAAMPAKRIN
ncbi:MAG: serine hydrolase [Undibacterium sp.]|nr:serine hydrolase [Undibacterium sp.]